MSLPIRIHYRTDFNMRKGKLAAQCAHALMGFGLNTFQFEGGRFWLRGNNFKQYCLWRQSFKIQLVPVDSEVVLLGLPAAFGGHHCLITDQGRTEFGGVTTHTCLAFDNELGLTAYDNKAHFPAQTEPQFSKQILVANRTLKQDKTVVAHHGALAAWRVLDQQLTFTENAAWFEPAGDAMTSWIFGSFAKIMLKAEQADLRALIADLPESMGSHVINR